MDPAATDNGRPLPDDETVAVNLDLALWGNNGRYADLPKTGGRPGYPIPKFWGHTNWLALDAAGNVLDTYHQFDLLAARPAQP